MPTAVTGPSAISMRMQSGVMARDCGPPRSRRTPTSQKRNADHSFSRVNNFNWVARTPAGHDIENETDVSEKKRLRAEARARRATLTDPGFAERIASFARLLGIAPGAIVAGYHPFRDEADPRGLMSALAALGHPLALPCIIQSCSALAFRRWTVGDALTPNAYGIAEPSITTEELVPAAVLVPLLAFDANGHRLGYGGGYYDRTFEALRRVRIIGVAYSGQEVAVLPREPHDHRLDMIVTEAGVRVFHHT